MALDEEELKGEYDFILENIDRDPILNYFRIYCFKGYKPFEIKEEKIRKAFNLLDEKKMELEEIKKINADLENEKYGVLRKVFSNLTELDGVGFPVASAILHFKFPDVFAIIDRNVLKGISCDDSSFKGEAIIPNLKNNPNGLDKNIRLYLKYLKFLYSKNKEEPQKTLRDIELPYFKKGKEKRRSRKKL